MTRDWDAMVVVGRVARAHGNRGHVIVNPETDFPAERFRAGQVLYLQREGRVEPVTIAEARFHKGRPILRVRGIETISDAERLANLELRIPEATLVPLPPGTFYRHDLIGCTVTTITGIGVGTVVDVDGSRESDRLVVAGPRGEVLIPFAAGICVRVDAAARTIVIDPPAGLLELNQ